MKRYAVKITLMYLIIGSIWIVTTNNIVPLGGMDYKTFQTFKGLFFIVATALILFLLLRQTEIVTKKIVQNLKENVKLKTATEIKLQEERNILRTIIDNIPDYIYIKDADNNFLVSNKILSDFLGVADDASTLTSTTVLDPAVISELEAKDAKIISDKVAIVNHEQAVKLKNGSTQRLLMTRVPLLDEDGNCTGLVGISKDISGIQKKFERDKLLNNIIQNFGTIAKLDDALQSTIEIISTALNFDIAEAWTTNSNRNTFDLSAKWSADNQAYFENHRTTLPLDKGLISDAAHEGRIRIWRDIQNQPNLLQKEFAATKKLNDAVVIPIKYKGCALVVFIFLCEKFPNDLQEITSLLEPLSTQLGFHIDKKNNEIELRDFNDRINAILDNTNDGFISFDQYWNITYWNKAAERLFGIDRKVMVGKKLLEILDKDEDYRFLRIYQEVFETQKSAHFEQVIPSRDLCLEMNVYPSKDGLSVFFKDITQIKNLDSERRLRLDELNQKNAELEQFAYIASHDLQEPLRMVTSFLTQIDRKYNDILDDKGKQYIFYAVDGAVRMRKIILDLLEYSRTGKEAFSDDMVDISEIVTSIIKLNHTFFEEKKAVLTMDKLPTIRVKKPMIRQLFQNIIINALRYAKSDTPPKIFVSSKELSNSYLFSIKDNGVGIPEEYYDKIFVLFQRLYLEQNVEGTGLGLAIAKKIVEAHEGTIWVESEVGQGTTFYFTIKK